MATKSFDDTNGNGITRENSFDSGNTFSSRVKNNNYGGTGGSNNSLIYYQGAGTGARKVSSTGGHGFSITGLTARNTTTATYRTAMVKQWITNYGALNPAGMDFCIGDTTNDQHFWTIADDGTIPAPGWEVPAKGGFLIKPVDLTLRAFLRGTVGTPTVTAVTVVGSWVSLNSTAGTDQNNIIDALDYIETGFHAVGGDSTDPDITFDDFVDQDEGASSTNFDRVGLWQTLADEVYQFYGKNIIGRTYGGTVTASGFTDSNKTLVCPGGYVREGFNLIEFDIGNASTTVDLDGMVMSGTGRSERGLNFDATSTATGGDVDTTNNEIDVTDHRLQTGEQILYSNLGNTNNVVSTTGGESQLVTGTTGPYYYAIRINDNSFGVASSFANALAGTKVTLTAHTGETHRFTRTPDTRPDFSVTGSSGTFTLDDSTLNGFRTIAADGGTFTNVVFNRCKEISALGGTFASCTFNSFPIPSGDAAVSVSSKANIEKISNATFVQGELGGHAVSISLNSASLTTINLSGWSVSGYETTSGGSTGNTVFLVDNAGGGDVTINMTGGSGTFSYEKASGYTGTVTINQTVSVTIKCVDADTGAAIQGVSVSLGTSTDGTTDNVISAGTLTNASGEVSASYSGTTPQAVTGYARKGTNSPLYKSANISNTIGTGGLSATIPMTKDE